MPNVRDQLFDAARRVLLRNGPDALTSRAVTTEAGVAKGILHRHFPGFDAFLVSLVLSRIELVDHQSAELRASAGSGTLPDNVAGALIAVLTPDDLAIVSLVMSRHELLDRLRLTTPTGIPVLAEATKMIAAYLTAERGLGRLPRQMDVDAVAMILVGAAHLQAAGHDRAVPDLDEVRGLVRATIGTAIHSAYQCQPGVVHDTSSHGPTDGSRG